jgi:putative transposase
VVDRTMPSTHTSLKYHIVFSTKERCTFIDVKWRDRLHAYLGGIVRSLDGVALAIGGVADHVHLLVGLNATHSVAQIVREVKVASTKWVHSEIQLPIFSWQEGYGAFTVGPNSCDAVVKYILNQEEHHRTKTFQEEYLEFLQKARLNLIRGICGDVV